MESTQGEVSGNGFSCLAGAAAGVEEDDDRGTCATEGYPEDARLPSQFL